MKTPVPLSLAMLLVMLASCSGGGKHTPSGPAQAARNDTSGSSSAPASDTLARGAGADSASVTPPPVLTYEQRQGRYLYAKYCVICHGAEGKGDGFNAFNLDPKPGDFTDSTLMARLSDQRIEQTISGGGRSVNKSPLMPSWGGRIKKEEIGFLRAYVRNFTRAR